MSGAYMVTRPYHCCGETTGMGSTIVIGKVAPLGEFALPMQLVCPHCLKPFKQGEVFGRLFLKPDFIPMYRLTKLPPDERGMHKMVIPAAGVEA